MKGSFNSYTLTLMQSEEYEFAEIEISVSKELSPEELDFVVDPFL